MSCAALLADVEALKPEKRGVIPSRAGTHEAFRYVHPAAPVCENAQCGLRRRMGCGEVLPPAVISPLPEVFRAVHLLDTPAQPQPNALLMRMA